LNTEKEILNVAYCLDENYNLQMITSMNSFLQHYRGPVKIHILHNNPASLKEILKLLKNFKNVISIEKYKYLKNKDFIFPAIENYHVTEATYYRLFLHEYLPMNISKLLYLDPDVITMNEVTKIIDEQFNKLNNSNYLLAAVNYTKSINATNQEMLNRLEMESNKYFNAGVLFIDYKKWLNSETGRSLLSHSKKMVSSNIELKQHDQDILNSYFDGHFFELEKDYNYPILERFYKQDKKVIEKNSFFIHYVGKEKPWLLNGIFTKIAKYYQDSFKDFNNGIHFVANQDTNLKKIFKKYKLTNFFNLNKLIILIRVLKKYIYL